jgi:hypothetical protein
MWVASEAERAFAVKLPWDRLQQAHTIGDLLALVARARGAAPDEQEAAAAAPAAEVPSEPIRALREAAATMADNAGFVLRELDRTPVPEDLRDRVRTVWRELADAAAGARVVLHRVPAGGGSGADTGALEAAEARLGRGLLAADELVRALDDARGDPSRALVAVLVTESAANVMTAFSRFRRATRELGDSLPLEAPPRLSGQEPRPPTPERKHELRCASCGSLAATVEVGPSPFHPQRQALVYSGLVRQQAFLLHLADEVFPALADGRVGEVHGMLGEEGIDAWCPECAAVYCARHYQLETQYDDDFYDCTYATCPRGHRRMVDD